MSRRLLAPLFGLLLLATGSSHALAGTTVRIRGIDVGDFPKVAVTVSVQGGAGVSTADVHVLENDANVRVTGVQPLGLSSDQSLDVVLAIDTSNSMAGAPLATAFAAARQFVTQVPSWVRVGLLTFADRPEVVQPITSDRQALVGSLASPPSTALGTALFDAVATASSMFSGTGQRNIILLTDGQNTTGAGDIRSAVAAAKAAHVTIFSVGLEGADTDVSTLKQLSQLTSGTYASASPSDLGAAYNSLVSELSQQYVITYGSRAPYGNQASVKVVVGSVEDEAGFLAPAPPVSGPAPVTALERFFRGPLGLVVPVGLAFLAAFALTSVLLGLRVRADRERQLAHAMAAPPQIRPTGRPKMQANPLTGWIPQPLVGAAGRVAQQTGLAGWLDARLERAALDVRPGEFLAAMAFAGIGLGMVGGLALRNVWIALGLLALGLTVPFLLLSRRAAKRSRQLQAQLPDVLMIIASSLRAGHSFLQALDMVTKEIADPAGHEFTRAVTEIRLGRPVDEALHALADRSGSDDFEWSAMAINIQRQVGGNLAELLETVAGTIRERQTLRRQVRVLSAEGRLSVVILSVLPFLLATYLFFVRRDYLLVLFQTMVGRLLLVGAGTLMLIGYVWMRKVVRLDV